MYYEYMSVHVVCTGVHECSVYECLHTCICVELTRVVCTGVHECSVCDYIQTCNWVHTYTWINMNTHVHIYTHIILYTDIVCALIALLWYSYKGRPYAYVCVCVWWCIHVNKHVRWFTHLYVYEFIRYIWIYTIYMNLYGIYEFIRWSTLRFYDTALISIHGQICMRMYVCVRNGIYT